MLIECFGLACGLSCLVSIFLAKCFALCQELVPNVLLARCSVQAARSLTTSVCPCIYAESLPGCSIHLSYVHVAAVWISQREDDSWLSLGSCMTEHFHCLSIIAVRIARRAKILQTCSLKLRMNKGLGSPDQTVHVFYTLL